MAIKYDKSDSKIQQNLAKMSKKWSKGSYFEVGKLVAENSQLLGTAPQMRAASEDFPELLEDDKCTPT
jgi:hypothetical protein